MLTEREYEVLKPFEDGAVVQDGLPNNCRVIFDDFVSIGYLTLCVDTRCGEEYEENETSRLTQKGKRAVRWHDRLHAPAWKRMYYRMRNLM